MPLSFSFSPPGIILNTIPVALLLRPPIPKLPNDNSLPSTATNTSATATAPTAASINSNGTPVYSTAAANSANSLPSPVTTIVQIKIATLDESNNGNSNSGTSPSSQVQVPIPVTKSSRRATLLLKLSQLSNSFVTALASNVKLIQLLLRNPHFLILCCTQISFTWGWTTFVMVVVDFAVDRGIEISIAVVLLSAFAAADLCGRLGSGWISDKGLMKRKTVASSAITVIGLLLLVIPFASSYSMLFIISLLLGLASGSIMILFSILLVEYVGIEKMPVALGTSTFTCGMATMLRPAVIGFFRDSHNSYDGLFSFLAALALVSSVMWFIEPCIKLYTRSRTLTLTTGGPSKDVSSVVATT